MICEYEVHMHCSNSLFTMACSKQFEVGHVRKWVQLLKTIPEVGVAK